MNKKDMICPNCRKVQTIDLFPNDEFYQCKKCSMSYHRNEWKETKPCKFCGEIHPEQPDGDLISKCNKQKDYGELKTAGPYGPFENEISNPKYTNVEKALLNHLAESMQWMLLDLMHRSEMTDLPACQSDEMKFAINNYRDLCMVVGKDPTLL